MSVSWYANKIKKEYKLKTKGKYQKRIKVREVKELKAIIYNGFIKGYSADSTLKLVAVEIEKMLERINNVGGKSC